MTSQPFPNPVPEEFIHRLDQDAIDYHNTYLAWKPATHNVTMEEIRATPQKFALPWHQDFSYLQFVQNMKIPSVDGHDLPIRVYHPDPRTSPFGAGPYPIHVNFHGGGFVFGDLDSDGLLCMMVRNRAGIIVVDVDYRLCPENKFLTGHDDAWAALLWVRSNATTFNGNPTSISIGGVSAGGHLSAAMQQLAAANKFYLKLACLNVPLVTSMADFDGTAFPSYKDNQNAHFLNLDRMNFFRDMTKPKTQDETDALKIRPSYLYDPLSGNDGKFENICPTYIATADCDIIRDEGEAYGIKLLQAGTKVTMRRYQGAPHVFLNMVTTRNSKLCMDDICAELISAHGGSPVLVAAPAPASTA